MRSKEANDQYERMVAGMIKDIAFHQLFMEQFRRENAGNALFDHTMAFELLDAKQAGTVSAFELQGFLHQHGYEFEQAVCQLMVSSLDKSIVHLDHATFMEMVLPQDQQLRSECSYKFESVPVSVHDFDFWRRVRAQTTLKLVQKLVREAQFYSELQKRRTQFCHYFFGDVYTLTNLFGQRSEIGYSNIHDWLAELNILFNPQEYMALLRRAKYISGEKHLYGMTTTLTKEELVELVVTNNLSLKDKKPKKFVSKTGLQYDTSKFSYYQREKPRNDTPLPPKQIPIESTFLSSTPSKGLSYKYRYPQAQMTTSGSLFLLGQSLRTLSLAPRHHYFD